MSDSGDKTGEQDLLNLPIQERRLALARKGQQLIDDWKQSDFFRREKLKEEKQQLLQERRKAAALRRKGGFVKDTLGTRAAARAAAARAAKADAAKAKEVDISEGEE